MARQRRLAVPGQAHLVVIRGHNGSAIVTDAADADRLLQSLRDAAAACGVTLIGYGLSANELRLAVTPPTDTAIARMVQTLGRRYVAWFNQRHVRSGALWDGRFRSAVVEPGAALLAVLRSVDAGIATAALPLDPGEERAGGVDGRPTPAWTSAAHRTGGPRDSALVDPTEYWLLGNTPFERESRYRELLTEPLSQAWAALIDRSPGGAGVIGSPEFKRAIEQISQRSLQARPRGRPRRSA